MEERACLKQGDFLWDTRAAQREARGAGRDESELPLTLLRVRDFRQEAPHSSYHNYTDRGEQQRGNFFDTLEALKLLRSHVDRGKHRRRKRAEKNGE